MPTQPKEETSSNQKILDDFLKLFTKYYKEKNEKISTKNILKKTRKKIKKFNLQNLENNKINKWIFTDLTNESLIPVITKIGRKEIEESIDNNKRFNIFRKHINDFILPTIKSTISEIKKQDLKEIEKEIHYENLRKLYGKVNFEKSKNTKKNQNPKFTDKYINYQKDLFYETGKLLKTFYS